MREFARLFHALDVSTSTAAKVAALRDYLALAPDADAAWAVYFLAGGKPRQSVPMRLLREFAIQSAGIAPWLFDECYAAAGDLAETVALLLPPPTHRADGTLAEWIEARLLPLRGAAPADVHAALREITAGLTAAERFVLVKLIGGGFRVGVSRQLVVRALAEVAGLDAKVIAQRMIGYTDKAVRPEAARYRALIAADDAGASLAQPYPFFLSHALQLAPEDFEAALGPVGDWLAEWKFDGIRAQLVQRAGETWLWSRGEELIGERFPEIVAAAARLPDGTVLDGEVLAWREGPLPFALLQQRIGRKTLTPKVLAAAPARFVAFDVLEIGGVDWRDRPQAERRAALETLAAAHEWTLSPRVESASWEELAVRRAEARARAVEGLMLKRLDARYGVGRTKDPSGAHWWKWKIDPYAVDAVLVYAHPGHGRRASLYTDYTFAVWDESPAGRVLVPFAKAYSGLTDAEIRAVDAIVRKTTVERFGPVRALTPTQVFEIGFEGIQRSPRHKSGIAVRFPRMLRWRQDKRVEEADTLATLRGLLGRDGPGDATDQRNA
jgi:DNA ligase-1